MRIATTRIVVLCLATLAVASPLAAATLELPAEWPLGVDSRLFFELAGADPHLTSRAGGLPVLRARVMKAGESASLDVTSSGGSLTVRRTGRSGKGKAPRLRIDVELGPGRTVHVTGADLGIRVDDDLPEDAGRSAYRLNLDKSTAELFGARVSKLDAVASGVGLTGTEGALDLTLTHGGSVQVRGHRGRLGLVTDGAGTRVADHRGQIVSELKGGSLEIAGGEGTFTGTADGGRLSFDDWRGPVEVRARHTVVDVRGAEHRDRWRIDGRELQVTLEGVHGTVEAALDGGSLSGSDLYAGDQVTAGGARVDLVEAAAGVRLALVDDAAAVLVGIRGGVEAEVTDSLLEIDRVDRLQLTGGEAEVSVRRVERLDLFEVSNSELILDLRGIRHGPTLDLGGSGYARVQLSAPCIVQLTESDASLGSQVEVTDCELRTAGQSVSRQQDRLKYGNLRPTRLHVTLSPDAVLEVEGEP